MYCLWYNFGQMRISDSELKKLLLVSGQVKADQLAEAEVERKQSKEMLSQIVVKRKLISEKDLTKLYAQSINVRFVELTNAKIPREILTKIPERIARKYQAVLFGKDGSKLQLAMADPEDVQAADFIEKQIGSDITIYIATPGDILAAVEQYKGNLGSEITKAIQESSTEAGETAETEEVSSKELAADAPIAKTVNIILEYALKSRASDVHIEPREDIVQVRYRIDGVLNESMTLPRPILPAVVSRIKIMANLKIDEHRLPQDGRFKFSLGNKTVALRVSTLPVMDGEKVVMRLLDESSRAQTLEELGFLGGALESIKRNLKKPHGMILVTGPTGSGKSTTLYSILSLLNSPEVNISTVEDPVEYKIAGVNQTQVNPKAGMTFASGLRALLRQDPNVIMVGEIRDIETADLAVQAALTGHVVLSTLHTNNAATTLPRLLDMKIEPFLIASTVNTVVGQRLVRKLCPTCRLSYAPEGQELEDIKKDFRVEEAVKYFEANKTVLDAMAKSMSLTNPEAQSAKQTSTPAASQAPAVAQAAPKARPEKIINPPADMEPNSTILDKIASDPNIINRSAAEAKVATVKIPSPAASAVQPADLKPGQLVLYKAGPGCDTCGHGSYIGRMGIYEVLEVDEAISRMIVSHATSEEIQNTAIKAGMLTMQQDGFVKSLFGLTSIEEVLRVTKE